MSRIKSETRAYLIMRDDAQEILSSKYSIDEFIEMIKNGDIALSLDTIKGIKGAAYTRVPLIYDSKSGDWSNTLFSLDSNKYYITTLTENGVSWYHFPQILKMLNLYTHEDDSKAFEAFIPWELKRRYSPYGKGIKRTFINQEALELFGLSVNGKPIVKRRISLQFSGVTTYNVNMNYLVDNVNRIIGRLKSLEDKVFMCDVYRVLKQLE